MFTECYGCSSPNWCRQNRVCNIQNPLSPAVIIAAVQERGDPQRIAACLAFCEGVSTTEIEAAPAHLRLRGLLNFIDHTLSLVRKDLKEELQKERIQ